MTAYTPVPTVNTGDLWTAANHNTYVRDNFAAGVPDIFTTKGDLAVASGADAASRLGIGADWATLVAKASETLGAMWKARPQVCVRKSADQSIAAAGTAELTWDTEDYDTDAFHDIATNTERLVAPFSGYYLIMADILWDSSASGVRQGGIRAYISSTAYWWCNDQQTAKASNRHVLLGAGYLAAGDYVALTGYNADTGGAHSVLATLTFASSIYRTYASMIMLF